METINYTGQPLKAPQKENFEKLTADDFYKFVRLVADMRHQQRRYFSTRKPDALRASRDLERTVDAIAAELLDPTPKLF